MCPPLIFPFGAGEHRVEPHRDDGRHCQPQLEEKDGKFVNGGWDPTSSSPDFLWRPQTEAAFAGRNERNPFVDPSPRRTGSSAALRSSGSARRFPLLRLIGPVRALDRAAHKTAFFYMGELIEVGPTAQIFTPM